MERLNVTLFGGFGARLGSGRAIVLSRRKAQAILAYLGLRPGGACSRETLMALLWGDVPGDQARHSLRQTLADLRRALPNGPRPPILVKGDSLALNPHRVEVDVAVFERLAARQTRKALERADALYRGDLLAGLTVREFAFEEWLRTERDRLREVALRVLRHLLAVQISVSDLEPAVQTAMRLLAIDPMEETVHRALMQLYVRLGRRSAALRQYQFCAEVLHRELGVAPEAETRRLGENIAPKLAIAADTGRARPDPLNGGGGGNLSSHPRQHDKIEGP
jgi:DNA-binding SARP family transcriptional activator